MRTVRGATDHVVVVGAGLGGLSAAAHLLGAGRTVTILEREKVPGGRAGLYENAGYRFDTGPTVLTMPDLLETAFAALGENMSDWLELLPIEPAYRAHFADGSVIDVLTDVDAMSAQIAEVCGSRNADGYRGFVDWVSTLYRVQMRDFIDRNVDSPLDLLTPNLARLVAARGFGRLAPAVGRWMPDPRLQRIFSFQSMYAGLSPQDALALYGVISYMDCVAGVWHPRGGMHQMAEALAGALTKHGATIHYSSPVTRVELRDRRAVAVHTADDQRIACDAVVLNPDLPIAWRDLLGRTPATVRRLRYSPSCAVLLVGSQAQYSKTAHHNIHFGAAWRSVFDELIEDQRLMSDPSFLVSSPTLTDPSMAPAGREAYYVLFPTPNLDAAIDWATVGPRYRDSMIGMMQRRGYLGFDDAIEVEHLTTPLDWHLQGMSRGTPFAASHTFAQTGPFRPGNIWGDNVVFAGSGTRPGVGVPMVLISGRLAAQRITG
jgi:phytoene desaturase